MATLIQFKDRADGHFAKPHICTASVKDAVLAQMKERGYEVEAERGPSANMELGWGMAAQGEPIACFGIEIGPTGGVRSRKYGYIGFPCHEIEKFIRRLEEAEPRQVKGVVFYKVHGYLCCMCISFRERLDLLERMKKSKAKLRKRDDDFWEKWKAEHPVAGGEAPKAVLLPMALPEKKA